MRRTSFTHLGSPQIVSSQASYLTAECTIKILSNLKPFPLVQNRNIIVHRRGNQNYRYRIITSYVMFHCLFLKIYLWGVTTFVMTWSVLGMSENLWYCTLLKLLLSNIHQEGVILAYQHSLQLDIDMISVPTCIHFLCFLRLWTSLAPFKFSIYYWLLSALEVQYGYSLTSVHPLWLCWKYFVQQYSLYCASGSLYLISCLHSFNYNSSSIPDYRYSNICTLLQTMDMVLRHCSMLQITAISGLECWELLESAFQILIKS